MAKQNSREKILGDRKPGELIETFGDFWLGMAGALGSGLSTFVDARRKKKEAGDSTDFLTDATEALATTVLKAQEVTKQTRDDLKRNA